MNKKTLAVATTSAICFGALLSGCAQINEQISTIGRTTPENAPPGYHLFNDAETAVKHKDWNAAAQNYCDAAKVGHPQAKEKCVEYAYLAAAKADPWNICGIPTRTAWWRSCSCAKPRSEIGIRARRRCCARRGSFWTCWTTSRECSGTSTTRSRTWSTR